ncbi:MAG TPA: hypothetical protein VLL52_12280 [Anaerolineae bacterium]|nr:hypothetical protein [Anaerolineae bacterium]
MSNDNDKRIDAQISTNQDVIDTLKDDPGPNTSNSDKRIKELEQANRNLEAAKSGN